MHPQGPPEGEYDLVVMGSGSAGLAAALTAASEGLSVLVLEKTAKIGGTTAYSGGAIWIPANHVAAAEGLADSVEDAIAYLLATAPDGWTETDGKQLIAFARNAGPALELIVRQTPLEFDLLPDGDLFADAPGASCRGRMLTPRLLRRSVAGAWARKIRASVLPLLFTFTEVSVRNPLTEGLRVQLRYLPKVLSRLIRGERGMGAALVIGLLKGCLDRGCNIVTDARVVALGTAADGSVNGVTALVQDRQQQFRSRFGVVIASGGFEWNDELVRQHFPGPVDYKASPRANEGDGHLLAAGLGAELAHMDQANFNSAIPGRYEGKVQGLGWFYHVAPGSVVVRQDGSRFVNEEDHNLGLHLDRRDQAGQPVNLPAWFITDSSFVSRERIATLIARCEPNWITRADSLSKLARKTGIDAAGLERTVQVFNAAASSGSPDPVGRKGGKPICRPPYLAIPFNRSFISTKGGPRTDDKARVLRRDGSVIEGLYCAGVAMANPLGTKAVSTGTTLGPNLTWGFIAGQDAAARKRKAEG